MTKKYVVEKNDFDAHVGNKSNPHGVTKAQVGLSNADNTADNVKSVASATKLTTARAINGVAFDGTKNISIDAVTAAQLQEVKNSVSDGKTKVANAITGKGISTATNATFATMANNINAITTLSQGTNDANATAAQILSGRTAYVKGSKITGTIPSKGAATITPSISNQTITAGQYLSGNQTIAGSGNLVPGNIKQGVNIFGVVGSLSTEITMTKLSQSSYLTFPNPAPGRVIGIKATVNMQYQPSDGTERYTSTVYYYPALNMTTTGGNLNTDNSDTRNDYYYYDPRLGAIDSSKEILVLIMSSRVPNVVKIKTPIGGAGYVDNNCDGKHAVTLTGFNSSNITANTDSSIGIYYTGIIDLSVYYV